MSVRRPKRIVVSHLQPNLLAPISVTDYVVGVAEHQTASQIRMPNGIEREHEIVVLVKGIAKQTD